MALFFKVSLWPCIGFFSLDIPGLCWASRVVQGVGFAYILVSAVAHGAQAHGVMLVCCKAHEQKYVVL